MKSIDFVNRQERHWTSDLGLQKHSVSHAYVVAKIEGAKVNDSRESLGVLSAA